MKFYGRENEICELRKIRQLSKAGSRMTVLTGRRRIGKTELVDKALNDGAHPWHVTLLQLFGSVEFRIPLVKVGLKQNHCDA